MLTKPALLVLATASFVGVVGWPVLAVIAYAWLTELAMTDLLWWVCAPFILHAISFQWWLSRVLWHYLDPRS